MQAAASLEKMSIKSDGKIEPLVLIDDRKKSQSPVSSPESVEEPDDYADRHRFISPPQP